VIQRVEIPAPPPPPDVPDLPGFVTVQTGPPPAEWIGPVLAILAVAVLAAILLFPLVKAWARRIEARGADAELRGELDELRNRLADVEQHQVQVAELEERLDFAERLLAQSRTPDRIGPA
jgi:flagellar biosynthesis/type III secretory pathway M-ring protein FliF/YscJ